ncbi:MAG: BON domain-containing protein [Proteobacteria bacterium]|nr:BON domain-containing protein [Pseudomonadota bacterium]
MKSDRKIKLAIESKLRSASNINETDIALDVNNGDVTLSGFADSYLAKYRAEIAVRRIRGVTAVANHITVRPLSSCSRAIGP